MTETLLYLLYQAAGLAPLISLERNRARRPRAATPWNASPRDSYGTPGPGEDAVQNTPLFEENGPDKFKGIDIMRAVRSFDPCLPCGVHMFLGDGKELEVRHVPMFGAHGEGDAMTRPFDAREFQGRLQRLDVLLQEVGRYADPLAQAHTREIVQSVLSLHGVALQRLIGRLSEAGIAGVDILDACARDDLVSGLLLLHDLHPLDVQQRVRLALDDVRPYLHSHGGNVELLEVDEGTVRLRLQGSCHSCPSSAVTMQQSVEAAIYARAPEVTEVLLEQSVEPTPEYGARLALPLV